MFKPAETDSRSVNRAIQLFFDIGPIIFYVGSAFLVGAIVLGTRINISGGFVLLTVFNFAVVVVDLVLVVLVLLKKLTRNTAFGLMMIGSLLILYVPVAVPLGDLDYTASVFTYLLVIVCMYVLFIGFLFRWFYALLVGISALVFMLWGYLHIGGDFLTSRLPVIALRLTAFVLLVAFFRFQLERLILELIRQRERAENALAQLHQLSMTDPLTGLLNRRSFEDYLINDWKTAARNGQPVAILMIDIDFFKQLNDNLGHLHGDACVTASAQAIRSCLNRGSDRAARYGGDEFIIALTNTDAPGARTVAENLRAAVASLALPHPKSTVAPIVTFSIGIATVIPGPNQDPTEIIGRADRCLYQAKAAGRNRVVHEDLGGQTSSEAP